MRRRVGRVVVSVLVGALCSPVAHAADDARDLIDGVWARFRSVGTERAEADILVVAGPKAEGYSRAEAETLARDGARGAVRKRAVQRIRYAADRRDRIHVLFSLPAEDAGTGFLVWREAGDRPDDQWLYLPGLGSTRRVPVSSTQTFVGTNLLYEDVRELAGERTERYDYERLPPDALDGRACEVVRATPKPGVASAYAARRIWIDREWLFVVKVEYLDRQERHWKILRASGVREVAPGVRRADLVEMRDRSLDEATLLVTREREVGIEIPPEVFTVDSLSSGVP